MRYLLIALLLFSSLALAQSAVPRAVDEMFDLKPRCERGDIDEFLLEVDYLHLDSNGIRVKTYRNQVFFTRICLGSSADSLRYEYIIDTMKVGILVYPSAPFSEQQRVIDFEGHSFQLRFGKGIPTRDGCYHPGDLLGEEMAYIDAYEFYNQMTIFTIFEQLRFTAGRQLAYIGDTLTMALPAPICFKLPGIVNSYHLDQKPFHLRVAGITKHGGVPCAIVDLSSRPSELEIDFVSRDPKVAIAGIGSSMILGDFLVSLVDGQLVGATVYDRLEALLMIDDKSKSNRVQTISRLSSLR
jgi:hypothetical protein